MHIYRNDVLGQNNAPSIPTGLNATVQAGSTVLLEWLPANDDHTPAPAITYDIVIVRKGTHVPIGKTQVTTDDILTRLPEPGNISAVTEWSLTGLQDGQYEWRLRAVDAAYVGSFNAFGYFNIGISTTIDPMNNLPLVYSIEQNYPNPFNPTTTIKYSIPQAGLVTIKLYNIIGAEVTKLVNETKQAGNYEVSFDATGLPSGAYFYRLQAGSFIDTKKMILLK